MSINSLALPSPGEVHLWLIRLNLPPGRSVELLGCLTVDEHERADRLLLPRIRESFIAARGQLRQILAAYLSRAPSEIDFFYGPHGKPELLNPKETPLRFNLSHSGEFGLLAINDSYPIGVDIERLHPGRPYLKLSERFFSLRERTELRNLPEKDREWAFYACWTRKEAYLKAIGTGLITPLHSFDISLTPGEPPKLFAHRNDPFEPGRWHIAEVPVPAGYRGAVATQWQQAIIDVREWP